MQCSVFTGKFHDDNEIIIMMLNIGSFWRTNLAEEFVFAVQVTGHFSHLLRCYHSPLLVDDVMFFFISLTEKKTR